MNQSKNSIDIQFTLTNLRIGSQYIDVLEDFMKGFQIGDFVRFQKSQILFHGKLFMNNILKIDNEFVLIARNKKSFLGVKLPLNELTFHVNERIRVISM